MEHLQGTTIMQVYTDVELLELPDFFSVILDDIIDKEGEWSDDENDHPTRYGIRQLVADKCGYAKPLRSMSLIDAKKCWALHSWYWPRYDLIAQQSYMVAKHVIDTSGPAGISQATKHLQTMLNNLNSKNRYGPDLTEDGLIGLNTSMRLGAYLDHRGVEGDAVLAFAINAFQLRHMSLTAVKNVGKRDFIFGWWRERCFKDARDIYDYSNSATEVKRHNFTHV